MGFYYDVGYPENLVSFSLGSLSSSPDKDIFLEALNFILTDKVDLKPFIFTVPLSCKMIPDSYWLKYLLYKTNGLIEPVGFMVQPLPQRLACLKRWFWDPNPMEKGGFGIQT
jgi:hypothetical protein